MSGSHRDQESRLSELLAGRALGDLSADEQAELNRLLADHSDARQATLNGEELEFAAAAMQRCQQRGHGASSHAVWCFLVAWAFCGRCAAMVAWCE